MEILRTIKNLTETNKLLSSAFDTLAETPIYKSIIYHRINRYITDIKINKKYNVIIETTNICNARCVMCPHTKMKRKQMIMDDTIFYAIIERLKDDDIKPLAFLLNGFGEPFTDKKILKRVNILKKNFPLSAVKFYSNFSLVNREIIHKILNSGLDEINISFNGYSKKSYEKVMKLKYDKTLSNVKFLLAERKRRNNKLKIRFSMALVSNNDKHVKSFIDKWKTKVDSVSVNKIHSYCQAVQDCSGINKINYNKLTYPCKYLWNTLVVGVSGDLFLCCLDYDGKYQMGNIKDSKILDIFYSKKYENIRRMHLQNKIKKLKICSECYTPYHNGVEWLISNLY